MDESLNEFYLWHGSSPAGVAGISADGFKLSMAGSHAGTMSRIPGVLVAISFMVPEGSRSDENHRGQRIPKEFTLVNILIPWQSGMDS